MAHAGLSGGVEHLVGPDSLDGRDEVFGDRLQGLLRRAVVRVEGLAVIDDSFQVGAGKSIAGGSDLIHIGPAEGTAGRPETS